MPFPVTLPLVFLALSTTLGAQQLAHPEDLAGRWEAPDGQGGQVGMDVTLSTTVPSSATDLVTLPQAPEHMQIALYRRSGSDVDPLGFNFISTAPPDGAIWDGDHLRFNFHHAFDTPEMHLDLTWVGTAQAWIGTFERGPFRKTSITLTRPTNPRHSSFVGTWFDSSGIMNNCLHIAQAPDGSFTGWSDDLQIPGQVRYANGLHAPDRIRENYGEIAKVAVPAPDRIAVELRAYTAMCCSHPFNATLSRNGSSLVADSPDGPNQAPHRAMWTRVHGDSCLAVASRRHHENAKAGCPTSRF